MTIRELLGATFGFDGFLPGQAEVIERLVAGRSALAIFPTGGGKSLCYQLPALALDGLTLVVSPLIALMKDQLDFLEARGVPAARLDSSLDAGQVRETLGRLRSGALRLLYVAPERCSNERFRAALAGVDIALFVVDEAHCISEWGHNFRPEYLKLTAFARRCGAGRVLALTATATPAVAEDIRTGFGIEAADVVNTGFHRPNLVLRSTVVAAAARDDALLDRLARSEPGPTLVYVTRQRTAEEVAARLAAAGHPARAYHAGMDGEARASVQDWFMTAEHAVLAATIAFGMGIDKPDIRAVIHYNLPKSLENYAQEIGRAGRDGRPSTCEVLACPEDVPLLENFAHGDTPTGRSIGGLLEDVFEGVAPGEVVELSHHDLSVGHDLRPTVLRTLLVSLELAGLIEEGTPVYRAYRFRPLVPLAEIPAAFEGERRRFLDDLLGQAVRKRAWHDLDAGAAAVALGQPRERIVRALGHLEETGRLEVKASSLAHRYRVLERPGDLAALADRLLEGALEREGREIARVGEVLALVETAGCKVAHLLAHFGESLPDPAAGCGHCGPCLDGPRPPAAGLRDGRPAIDPALWRAVAEVWSEQARPLQEARALARFACGITSPRLTQARLSRHRLFGALAGCRFADVLERAVRCLDRRDG